MYCCQDANMYEKVTSVISWNCPAASYCCRHSNTTTIIGITGVAVAYHSIYDNIQLYESSCNEIQSNSTARPSNDLNCLCFVVD